MENNYMEEKKYYVYKWYYKDSNKVFYVGKGSGNRYKNISKRNHVFKDIYTNNPLNCAVDIIAYFNTEEEAFKYEEELIAYYWSIKEAEANIDKGGAGGYHSQWTERLKEYMSKYNPMYETKNRMIPHLNPPMNNPIFIEKYQWSRGHNIVIDNVCYPSVYEAARQLHKAPGTIFLWGKRGTSESGLPCYYTDAQIDLQQKSLYTNNSKHNAKPIIIDGVQYSSIIEGAKAINGRAECLSRCLSAGKMYKGHICSYANQQPSQENS